MSPESSSSPIAYNFYLTKMGFCNPFSFVSSFSPSIDEYISTPTNKNYSPTYTCASVYSLKLFLLQIHIVSSFCSDSDLHVLQVHLHMNLLVLSLK